MASCELVFFCAFGELCCTVHMLMRWTRCIHGHCFTEPSFIKLYEHGYNEIHYLGTCVNKGRSQNKAVSTYEHKRSEKWF